MSRSYAHSPIKANRSLLSSRVQRRAVLTTESPPAIAGLPVGIWQAGNAALSQLLDPQGNGRSLDASTQTELEQRFGQSFAGVQIHDAPAAARMLQARAFVQGENVYLGANAPALDTAAGKSLLTHELAHVVQQRQAGAVNEQQVSQPGDRFEQAADRATQQAMQGEAVTASVSGTPPGIQRDSKDAETPLFSLPGLKMRVDDLPNFALNQATLPPQHKPRITSIALQIRQMMGNMPGGKVILVGHTDTTGPEKHNLKLGEQRAETVRQELAITLLTVGTPLPKLDSPKGSTPAFAPLGSALPEMKVESQGESDLAEPTKDETPNPSNRRVEIFFQAAALTYKPDLAAIPSNEKPAAEGKPPSKPAPPPPSVPDWVWKEAPDPYKDLNNQSLNDAVRQGFRDGFGRIWNEMIRIVPAGKVRDWLKGKGGDIADAALDAAVDGALDQALGKDNSLDDKAKEVIKKSIKAAIQTKRGSGKPSEDIGKYKREPPPGKDFEKPPGVIQAPPIPFDFPSVKTPEKPPVETGLSSQDDAALEKAIQQISADALIPEKMRGKPEAGSLSNAQDVARALGRLLDQAHRKKQTTVELRLSEAYNQIGSLGEMYDAMGKIVSAVRAALSHHASNVETVKVYFGNPLPRVYH